MDIIGLFGGTFNPIHRGHLALAHSVLDTLACTQIRFIPAALPPHKTAPGVSAEQRAHMVALAIEAEPRFVLDRCELARHGPSYTIDTLMDMRARFAHASLVLMMGQDSYQQLPGWHRWQSLLAYAHLLVIHRADSDTELQLHAAHTGKDIPITAAPAMFTQHSHGYISYLGLTPPSISSTRIRMQLAEDDSHAQDSLPASVWAYVTQQQLYQRHHPTSPG